MKDLVKFYRIHIFLHRLMRLGQKKNLYENIFHTLYPNQLTSNYSEKSQSSIISFVLSQFNVIEC